MNSDVGRIQPEVQMGNRWKRNLRWLLAATVISSIGLIIFIGLHEYLYTFDPYSWLDPKVESVESRNLWNHRKDLYRVFILLFFFSTFVLDAATTITWWHRRHVLRITKHA